MRESLVRLASEEAMSRRGRSGCKRARVELLDGEHFNVDVDRKAKGADLLDKVCDDLEIVERDYFGLLHVHRGDPRTWVDLGRRLSKTFRNEPWDVKFTVKFYPPEPTEVDDEHARYHLTLAVRTDIMEGRLACSGITLALLASYSLQAQAGDRAAAAAAAELAPPHALTPLLHDHIDQLYRNHKGQSPAEAERRLLAAAARLPQYGGERHAAQDSLLADIALVVAHHGLSVYRDDLLMNRFPWPKIVKISYKKREFCLHLRAGQFEEFATSVVFRLVSTAAAKKLWQCAVEHHMFFRRWSAVRVRRVAGLAGLGCRTLSCRRTLHEVREQQRA